MRFFTGLFGALVAVSGWCAPASAQVARTELHTFPSRTISDRQFLNGETGGTAVTIAGQLRIPRAGNDRLPVVILLHGSGGFGANMEVWSSQFNSMGIATFAVDSFTGRGLQTVSAEQARLGRLNMILDAYGALRVLTAHPRIDPGRIALMGFSRGGQSVLYAAMERFKGMHGPQGPEFAAYLPFYPSCGTAFREDERLSGKPVRIHHGSADDYVPVAPCRTYVERLKKAGQDVTLTEYPDAHHTFDNPLLKEGSQPAARSQTVRRCATHEADGGVIVNSATGKPFDYEDPCVERGPHVGYNAAAHAAATQSVKDFLRVTFRLE